MKKVLLTLFAATVAFAASAQLSGGVKAGLNLSTLGGDAEEVKILPGFHVGGYLNIGISDALSVQPEILFNAVGAKDKNVDDASLRLNYISIPVMVKYNITDKFNVQAGPQLGILATAKSKFGDEDLDVKDDFKSTDFGFNIGLGLDLGKFNVAARYSIGLANIAKEEDGGNGGSDDKYTNNNIQISVGYTLFGGK